MSSAVPDDVLTLLTEHGFPASTWYVGSAEGAWRNVSKEEWLSFGESKQQPPAEEPPDAPSEPKG